MEAPDSKTGGAREILLRPPVSLLILLAIALGSGGAFAQPGWEPEDVVVYADYREVIAGDLTSREVIFATGGGLWRLDRETAQSLPPIRSGRGSDRSFNLSRAKSVIWMQSSGSSWLATKSGIYYYRWGIDRWARLDEAPSSGIKALGRANDSLFVLANNRVGLIDPFGFRYVTNLSRSPEGIQWIGRRDSAEKEYPYYSFEDFDYRFERRDGRLVDRDFNEYHLSHSFPDPDYDRRYFCYPGLGIGVVEEQTGVMSLIQTGPAGTDVKGIAIAGDGSIWIGGDNPAEFDGISCFNRAAGTWKSYSSRRLRGLESHRCSDVIYGSGRIWFVSDAGLVRYDPLADQWKLFDRFTGAPGGAIRALGLVGEWLVVGGDEGAVKASVPDGLIFKLDNPKLKDMKVAQIAAQGDTAWLAGLSGVYRGTPEGRWSYLGGDEVIGDEPARSIAVSDHLVAAGGRSGVRLYNRRSGEWRAILSKAYLGGGEVFSLAIADPFIWIGTDRGLYRYNQDSGGFLSFGQREGIPAGRIQRIVVEADSLWLGTPGGLVRFIWNRPNRDIE